MPLLDPLWQAIAAATGAAPRWSRTLRKLILQDAVPGNFVRHSSKSDLWCLKDAVPKQAKVEQAVTPACTGASTRGHVTLRHRPRFQGGHGHGLSAPGSTPAIEDSFTVVVASRQLHHPPIFRHNAAHPHPDIYDSLARVEVVTMSDQVQELLDTPHQFLRDGLQFVNKCQKRKPSRDAMPFTPELTRTSPIADGKEFTKICQAVGTGFVIMGVVGYVVKLSTAPLLRMRAVPRLTWQSSHPHQPNPRGWRVGHRSVCESAALRNGREAGQVPRVHYNGEGIPRAWVTAPVYNTEPYTHELSAKGSSYQPASFLLDA